MPNKKVFPAEIHGIVDNTQECFLCGKGVKKDIESHFTIEVPKKYVVEIEKLFQSGVLFDTSFKPHSFIREEVIVTVHACVEHVPQLRSLYSIIGEKNQISSAIIAEASVTKS